MSPTQAVRTRHPKEVTRATILQKAFEMYRDRELIHGDERLTVVLESLGYTTGAGYQIWANQAAFREDLKVYVAENIEYASLRSIEKEIVALAERNLPWDKHVLAAGDQFIRVFLDREEFYLSLRFFAMAHDRPASITDGMKAAYEQSSWEAMTLFTAVLERFERELADGVDMRQFTAAVTAALEGYALQARVRPEQIDELIEVNGESHHQFSLTFLGIANQYTRPISA